MEKKVLNYLENQLQFQNGNKNKLEKKSNSSIESISDADFSIKKSFVEKINNTTLFEFENQNTIRTGNSQVYSPKAKNNSNVFKSITFENTVNIEKETNNLFNTFNKLQSGDVLLLSLSGIDDKTIKSISYSEDNKPSSSYKEKIKKIESASEDNKTLLVSEKAGKVYLPYTKSDLSKILNDKPTSYNSLQDVVNKEFTLPFKAFKDQSSKTRFSETFNLLKNSKDYNFIKSISYAFKVANRRNLNPVIISACKSKNDLENYISCLDKNNLKDFKSFDIIYEINPL